MRLQVGGHAHLLGPAPAAGLDTDRLLQDFAHGNILERGRSCHLMVAPGSEGAGFVRHPAALVGKPTRDQGVPCVRLITQLLFGLGRGNQLRRVQPPDRPAADPGDGLGPQLITSRASASMSIVPQRTGQNRRLPVSSRR